MMWQWDLSATLGWASGGGPGGSWLNYSTPTPWKVRMSCQSSSVSQEGIYGTRNPAERQEAAVSASLISLLDQSTAL